MSVSWSTSETDSLLASEETALLRDRSECFKPGCRVRRVRSKGAVLVLLWCVAVSIAMDAFILSVLPEFLEGSEGDTVVTVVGLVCCPLAGFLGDIYFGRHKLLHISVLLMWFGSIATVVVLLVEYTNPSTATALGYSVVLPACIVVIAGGSAFQVASIIFGIDQMPSASTEEISAFIHWRVWSWFVGQLVINVDNTFHICKGYNAGTLFLALLATLVTSFVLCTLYVLKSWLIIEPCCQNPMKNITNVLKYALRHKHPVRRSALTYWEDKIPSRIDLGKMKYGGPYTNEQVEDVKTFFRIIIVTICILAFVVPSQATILAVTPYHYKHPSSCFADSFTIQIRILGVVYIPIYEFVIYPFAYNWIPSSLKRVAVFAFMLLHLSSHFHHSQLLPHRCAW